MQAQTDGFCSDADNFEAKRKQRMDSVYRRISDASRTLLYCKRITGVPDDIAAHWREMQTALLACIAPIEVEYDPSQEALVRMWTGFGLLRHLMPAEARLVVMAAAGVPLATIGRVRGQKIKHVQAAFVRAIAEIADAEAAERGREAA